MAGEINTSTDLDNSKHLFDKVYDLMTWVLKNDGNGVVKYEACYQITVRNMRNNIPDLIHASLHDTSVITRYEVLESLLDS